MSCEYAPEIVEELTQRVKNSLSLWGLSSKSDVALLNLSENATFRLSDRAAGKSIALRVHRIGYSSTPEINSELAWIEALRADRVVETAKPLCGVDGSFVQILRSDSGAPDRQAVAFEFLSGHEPENQGDLARWFEVIGAVTARMHLHSRSWARPEGFVRKIWTLESMVGPRAFWGNWRDGAGLDDAGRKIIAEALDLVKIRMDAYGQGPDRFGLVHADLRLANLLIDGDKLQFLDFDDMGLCWYMWDFAASLSFIEHSPNAPALLASWVRGYETVAPLAEADIEIMPTLVFLRRILLTAWLASHAEAPFPQKIGKDHALGAVRLAQDYLDGVFLRPLPIEMRRVS